jgi:hypothetical protein
MKTIYTLNFLFVDEMEQVIEVIKKSEYMSQAITIVEKRYFKSPGTDIDSGAMVLELSDIGWLYNLGTAVGHSKIPF